MSILNFAMKSVAKKSISELEHLEEISKDPMKYQLEFLMSIAKKNANCDYSKKVGMDTITSIEDFKKKIPVTTYDDYSEMLDHMALDKNNKELLEEFPSHFSKTSGTIGTPKKIPMVSGQVQVGMKVNMKLPYAMIYKEMGPDFLSGKYMALIEGNCSTLPCGSTYGAASAVAATKTGFGPFKDLTGLIFTSPLEARVPVEGTNTRYLHARFALQEDNVTFGMCTFSSFMFEVLRYIETNWEMLVHDIETGEIDPSINIPDVSMQSLKKKIKPMPKRAAFLRSVFSQGFETPFIPKVWPKMKAMTFVGGASFETYTNQIRQRYAGNDIKMLFTGICSSESVISTPFEMENYDSVLLPDCVFYEFRPLDEEDITKTLNIDELEVGGKYEIYVTAMCGFIRYRMKDAIEVTGFYHKNPKVRFLYRVDQTVSITGEKTTEVALRYSVYEAAKELGIEVYDYCMWPDVDAVPMRYSFLVEPIKIPEGVTKEMFRDAIDKYLAKANPSMGAKIKDGVCGPSELKILQPETFLLYRDMMIMKGAAAAQLKPVHIIMNERQRKFFYGLEDK